MSKIYVAGIGPGSADDITPAVQHALSESDVVIGYKYYFRFVEPFLKPSAQCVDTGMRRERERAEMAFRLADEGHTACVISSGDAGIYGMAPLLFEMASRREAAAEQASMPTTGRFDSNTRTQIIPLPGISAFQKAASLLGAPMGHDFCVISLSDLLTPWSLIERRIRAAASADFVTAIYNPRSNGRYWQLHRLKELFLAERSATNVVGIVRQAGREDQQVTITTLADFDPDGVDMLTIVIIGNSQSYADGGHFITPRGYYGGSDDALSGGNHTAHDVAGGDTPRLGQTIMQQSFATILAELRRPQVPIWRLWPTLHAVHTTADFALEDLLWMDDEATAIIHERVARGEIRAIVTDVSMVVSGLRKAALQRWGIEAKTYIGDARAVAMAREGNLTRAQAGIRVALEDYPEGRGVLFAFGNAPTALLTLCDMVHAGRCKPEGIIGATVGFVHVEESKHATKSLSGVPRLIVEGRRGGSNLAATLVNSILTYDDAEGLCVGREV